VQTTDSDGATAQSGLDRLAANLALGLMDDLLCGLLALVPDCVSRRYATEGWHGRLRDDAGFRGKRAGPPCRPAAA
jgi:hypothetical protein